MSEAGDRVDGASKQFEYFLARNDGSAEKLDLVEYGLFFKDGELTLGPNLSDGECEEDETDEEDDHGGSDEELDLNFGLGSFPSPLRISSKYKMETLRPLDEKLLRANRRINQEARPSSTAGSISFPSPIPSTHSTSSNPSPHPALRTSPRSPSQPSN